MENLSKISIHSVKWYQLSIILKDPSIEIKCGDFKDKTEVAHGMGK